MGNFVTPLPAAEFAAWVGADVRRGAVVLWDTDSEELEPVVFLTTPGEPSDAVFFTGEGYTLADGLGSFLPWAAGPLPGCLGRSLVGALGGTPVDAAAGVGAEAEAEGGAGLDEVEEGLQGFGRRDPGDGAAVDAVEVGQRGGLDGDTDGLSGGDGFDAVEDAEAVAGGDLAGGLGEGFHDGAVEAVAIAEPPPCVAVGWMEVELAKVHGRPPGGG